MNMRYKLLGKSGLRVSELCLGTMTFGTEWGWGADKKESRAVYDAYREAGGNFIDTANRYTEGTSEKYTDEFIARERESIVLATKYTLFMRKGDPNSAGNHRKNMMQSVEASLKRLKTDYIDLLWVHAWDYMTPVEEVMRGLDDLVRAGKILYAGVSDTPAWIVSQANTLAELRGWTRFTALQIEYSLIERTPERELLPMAQSFDMAVTPWAVLGSGILTGKYSGRSTDTGPKRVTKESRRLNDANIAIGDEVVKIAHDTGRKPSQVALNWVRRRKGLFIPILGARTVSQISENLGCLDFQLDQEHIQRLDEISKIDLGFPHVFLSQEVIRDIVYGGTYDMIDVHRNN